MRGDSCARVLDGVETADCLQCLETVAVCLVHFRDVTSIQLWVDGVPHSLQTKLHAFFCFGGFFQHEPLREVAEQAVFSTAEFVAEVMEWVCRLDVYKYMSFEFYMPVSSSKEKSKLYPPSRMLDSRVP
jgi:hypothetical protein